MFLLCLNYPAVAVALLYVWCITRVEQFSLVYNIKLTFFSWPCIYYILSYMLSFRLYCTDAGMSGRYEILPRSRARDSYIRIADVSSSHCCASTLAS